MPKRVNCKFDHDEDDDAGDDEDDHDDNDDDKTTKKIVDSELFTPGYYNNTQQHHKTSGPIFAPFCDKLHPFFCNFPLKNVHFMLPDTPYTQ